MNDKNEITRIGIAALAARLGVDRSTIWRWYRTGRFPPPHYLGERRVWTLQEIEEWETKMKSRPASARISARNVEHLHRTVSPLDGDETRPKALAKHAGDARRQARDKSEA